MSWVSSTLLVTGAFIVFVAGLGILSLPTFFMRMQAASKASAIGAILILAGATLRFFAVEVIWQAAILFFFLVATTPVATHALAEAAKAQKYDR